MVSWSVGAGQLRERGERPSAHSSVPSEKCKDPLLIGTLHERHRTLWLLRHGMSVRSRPIYVKASDKKYRRRWTSPCLPLAHSPALGQNPFLSISRSKPRVASSAGHLCPTASSAYGSEAQMNCCSPADGSSRTVGPRRSPRPRPTPEKSGRGSQGYGSHLRSTFLIGAADPDSRLEDGEGLVREVTMHPFLS
jgi:hypothetical protein